MSKKKTPITILKEACDHAGADFKQITFTESQKGEQSFACTVTVNGRSASSDDNVVWTSRKLAQQAAVREFMKKYKGWAKVLRGAAHDASNGDGSDDCGDEDVVEYDVKTRKRAEPALSAPSSAGPNMCLACGRWKSAFANHETLRPCLEPLREYARTSGKKLPNVRFSTKLIHSDDLLFSNNAERTQAIQTSFFNMEIRFLATEDTFLTWTDQTFAKSLPFSDASSSCFTCNFKALATQSVAQVLEILRKDA